MHLCSIIIEDVHNNSHSTTKDKQYCRVNCKHPAMLDVYKHAAEGAEIENPLKKPAVQKAQRMPLLAY